MGKLFDKKAYAVGRKAESDKRGSGAAFFSSKEDNDEHFNKFAGNELTIVGTHTVPAANGIKAFNVVLFDDGHQLSTSRLFSARGLKWPVGGNIGKWDYINACLANDQKLTIVPQKVESKQYTMPNTTKPAHFVNGVLTECKGSEKPDFRVTYYFEEQEFEPTDMSVLTEEA